jgi:hypothetical protein
LYGLLQALRSFLSVVAGGRVLLRTDSQASFFIIKKGASMRRDYNSILYDIFALCLQFSIVLQVEWLPRALNERADALSKFRDSSDWMLRKSLFRSLDEKWGPFQVDRFASHLNAQLPTFNSRWWCPGTAGVNAFTLDWSGVNNWVNPDFGLIEEIVAHMRFCRARGCIIIPVWPSRPWWHLFWAGPGVWAPFVKDAIFLKKEWGLFVGVSMIGGDMVPNFNCWALRVDFGES